MKKKKKKNNNNNNNNNKLSGRTKHHVTRVESRLSRLGTWHRISTWGGYDYGHGIVIDYVSISITLYQEIAAITIRGGISAHCEEIVAFVTTLMRSIMNS